MLGSSCAQSSWLFPEGISHYCSAPRAAADSVGVWGQQRAKAQQFFKTTTSVLSGLLLFLLWHQRALSCNLQRLALSLAEVHRHIETTKDVLK